jgi:hypothetical protein
MVVSLVRDGLDLAQEAAPIEEVAEGGAVFVARQPRLSPLRRMQRGIVPLQAPDSISTAALGGTNEGHVDKCR